MAESDVDNDGRLAFVEFDSIVMRSDSFLE
jgi:hypothetical protein